MGKWKKSFKMYNFIVKIYRLLYMSFTLNLCFTMVEEGRETEKVKYLFLFSFFNGIKMCIQLHNLFHLLHHEYIFMSIHIHQNNFKIQKRVLLNWRTIIYLTNPLLLAFMFFSIVTGVFLNSSQWMTIQSVLFSGFNIYLNVTL